MSIIQIAGYISANNRPKPWSLPWIPLAPSACQYVAVLIAITGLASDNSASAASLTVERLVPTCTDTRVVPAFAHHRGVFDRLGLDEIARHRAALPIVQIEQVPVCAVSQERDQFVAQVDG